ncbi:DUF2279 domain-containing protein [Hymenobacter busanensis]|uniref:DUF2279 domain-containing protein n=1 Tax=Hymenobacter busanensis TaxID=2607656 RepID=UPI00191C558D|nr:DUF2279 domain-containing protein [Hymenobacter busanensis]
MVRLPVLRVCLLLLGGLFGGGFTWAQAPAAAPPDTVRPQVAPVVGPLTKLPAEPVPPHRLPLLLGGLGAGYGGLYVALSQGWYTGRQVAPHWFNDFPEWKQLDKAGHFWGAFHESRGTVDMLRWAGVADKKAIWYGSLAGFLIQSPIEYFDSRDPAYGASATDLAANFLGSAGVLAQELAWREVRIMPKISFHLTPYAARRPNVLGSTVPERLLKDYNGQTYWLCTDVGAFLPAGSRWPRWLQPALGYGAQEVVYNDPDASRQAGLRPYRQYYLSLDVDLRRIPTRSKTLRRVFYALSIFHLPAPALELNSRRGLVAHGLYW